MNTPSHTLWQRLGIEFKLPLLWATLAGAAGGFIGHQLVAICNPFGPWPLYYTNALEAIRNQAFYYGCAGLGLSGVILIFDNYQSLRGRWNRDLLKGLPLFAGLGLGGGGLGAILNSITHLSGSALCVVSGMGVGASIGLLRKDKTQALRGAIGGAIGGLIGGLLLDAAYHNAPTVESVAWASEVGTTITGALIGFFMYLVQNALKSAWLVGVSAGPYQDKQYALNTARVTVGRAEMNDISLYRASELTMQSGALVNAAGQWQWQGEAVEINGQPQTYAALNPGDTLKLGGTLFSFQTRSTQAQSAVGLASPMATLNNLPQAPSPQVPAPSSSLPPVSFQSSPLERSPDTPPNLQGRNAVGDASWFLVGAQNSIELPAAPASRVVGRSPENAIVIDDPSVSSRHARLDVGNGVLRIIDLNSTNGTWVNGQRLQPGSVAALRADDHLIVGQQHYTVRQGVRQG